MLNKCYTRAQGPLSLSLTLGHTGEAIVVWEERRRGRRERGGAWIREKGGETDSNREPPQFPRTRNFLPGKAQGLWVPLVVATDMQPLAAQTDHRGCSSNI